MSETKIGCPCPPRDGAPRHPDGDTVTLREKLDFVSAFAIKNEFTLRRIEGETPFGEALAVLVEGYLIYGIEAWTLTDEKDQPIPVSRAAIRQHILSDPVLAEPLAEVADAQYGPTILPLVMKGAISSLPMPTDESTSATPEETPTPSSQSSTTTTQTDATAKTSSAPAGVSS